jgi:hypothetical protein
VHSLVLLTGNCTSMEGALYDATVKRAHRYHVIKVTGDPDDPERSSRMDLAYCRQLIADYGRNDPVVMINVLGEFPPTGIAKLLGPGGHREGGQARDPDPGVRAGVKVAALDIARQGLDSSVYTLRQGDVHYEQRVWRIPDLMLLADQVAMRLKEDKPDALIMLATGIGWGVVDRLKQLGFGELIIAVDEGTGSGGDAVHPALPGPLRALRAEQAAAQGPVDHQRHGDLRVEEPLRCAARRSQLGRPQVGRVHLQHPRACATTTSARTTSTSSATWSCSSAPSQTSTRCWRRSTTTWSARPPR